MKTIQLRKSEFLRAVKYCLPYGKCSPSFLMYKMHWTYETAKGVSDYINKNFESILDKYRLNLELDT